MKLRLPITYRSLACSALVLAACVGQPLDRAAVDTVLDDWHAAASRGDQTRYLDLFAPDAVFLGTDASERWTLEEFTAYVERYFPLGGWTYQPRDRHVRFSPQGTLAWVDELLENEKYGTLRGTSVLQRIAGEWRIAHYSMTFAVPNERSAEVVEAIRREPGAADSGQ